MFIKRKGLEKIVNGEDLLTAGLSAGVTLFGVYVYQRFKQPFFERFLASDQIEIIKNTFITYKDALPVSLGVGYVVSKIIQIDDYIKSRKETNYKKD